MMDNKEAFGMQPTRLLNDAGIGITNPTLVTCRESATNPTTLRNKSGTFLPP